MSEPTSFLTQLMSRRPGLDALEPAWRLIDDVLAGRVKRRGPRSVDGVVTASDGWYSPYFPKGRLEPEAEYSLRVELTPFFPETPQILASRLGALFRSGLQIELPTPPPIPLPAGGEGESASPPRIGEGTEGRGPCGARAMARFLKEAGRRHASFEDLAVQAACLAQAHGFCAALLDRDPLPADAEKRAPSAAEAAARNLGRPYLALYPATEILDWDFGSDGLLNWVKFGEQEFQRDRWDATPEPTLVYRVVDREAIHVYRVRRDGQGEWQVQAAPPLPHGFAGTVPVAFLHPFPAQDGIGRPILQRAAEADIAATRILSDLVWDLFLLGNPILTLKTDRSESEQQKLCVGASRYIPLRNGRPGAENPEELSFVQLDPTGIELLFRAHDLFASQATKSASGGGQEAAVPQQQSGVALAWRFKTGEERMLFMLARALEPFLNRCLELAAIALGVLPSPHRGEGSGESGVPVVHLPESFDVESAAPAAMRKAS